MIVYVDCMVGEHRWGLPVFYYHEIMLIYPYTFWVVIAHFSPEYYLLTIYLDIYIYIYIDR